MSISVAPSKFEGESVIEAPIDRPIMDLSKVYSQEKAMPEAYSKAFDASESQRSTNTDNAQVYQSQPLLEQVAVPVEIPTIDLKSGLLFLVIGFLGYKFLFKGRKT